MFWVRKKDNAQGRTSVTSGAEQDTGFGSTAWQAKQEAMDIINGLYDEQLISSAEYDIITKAICG